MGRLRSFLLCFFSVWFSFFSFRIFFIKVFKIFLLLCFFCLARAVSGFSSGFVLRKRSLDCESKQFLSAVWLETWLRFFRLQWFVYGLWTWRFCYGFGLDGSAMFFWPRLVVTVFCSRLGQPLCDDNKVLVLKKGSVLVKKMEKMELGGGGRFWQRCG